MKRPEETIHRAVAAYLKVALPGACYWTSIPNQRGTRKRFEMGILKALGVKAGAPDIILCWDGRFIGIELKAPGGKLSDNQESTSDSITLAGGVYTVARSVDDVDGFLRIIGVPLRASLRAAA